MKRALDVGRPTEEEMVREPGDQAAPISHLISRARTAPLWPFL